MTEKPHPERHGTAWSVDEQQRVYDAFVANIKISDIAKNLGRSSGGIRSCLKLIGLIDEFGNTISDRPPFTPTAAAQKRKDKGDKKPKKPLARNDDDNPNAPPEMNERFREALRLMEETDQNIFITGKAGTGKSTLLHHFCSITQKQPVLLASTGVAALNINGETIHRFFHFYIDVTPEKIRAMKKPPRNAKLLKKLKTIIIDEVSMVRADLLDCIDILLRQFGPRPGRPFGGVQMIFVGDLYQLPPVVPRQDQEIFAEHYATPYFFSAQGLRDTSLAMIELDKVYRQKDQDFVDLLNRIRSNMIDAKDLAHINSRVTSHTAPAKDDDFHITLTTTNAVADEINERHLNALTGKLHRAEADINGTFGKEYHPTATDLTYKIGAQIMLVNNDNERRWVNGSIGVIRDLREDDAGDSYLSVALQGQRGTVKVYPHSWEVYRFGIENNAIVSEPVGTFRQFPIRLAWAITIHKSQGKTFDRVAIAVGRGAFVSGQMYVALSRCTSFEGVTLTTALRFADIHTDDRISEFLGSTHQKPDHEISMSDVMDFIRRAIADKAMLNITYLKADDTRTICKLVPLAVGQANYQGIPYDGMKALCLPEEQERMFRVDRILNINRTAQ